MTEQDIEVTTFPDGSSEMLINDGAAMGGLSETDDSAFSGGPEPRGRTGVSRWLCGS
jgi:hypothetical protein